MRRIGKRDATIEKTFPDQRGVEFGRRTNWEGPIKQRPKYWGHLMNESDVAKASDIYEAELRATPLVRRSALWIMNLAMATTAETNRPLSVWNQEVVVREKRSRRKLTVIRNDSSASSDRVTAAMADIDELTASSFAEMYL